MKGKLINGKVYSLINPKNGLVFYIGSTQYSLSFRLNAHLTTKATSEVYSYIKHHQIRPEIVLLQQCEGFNVRDLLTSERKWVEKFLNDGIYLCNKAYNYNKNKRLKTYSFKSDESFMNLVRERIEIENESIKNWRLRKTLSGKINELLYDYISR